MHVKNKNVSARRYETFILEKDVPPRSEPGFCSYVFREYKESEIPVRWQNLFSYKQILLFYESLFIR